MELSNENIYMLGICFVAILFLFFMRQIKFIFKIFLRTSFGLTLIYLTNIFLSSAIDLKNLCVGLNFFTAAVVAVLGFPGIFFLYVIQNIL